MSVVPFRRESQKEQLIKIIEEFDFNRGAVVLYMDSDFEDMQGEFSIVSTYKEFGAKEAFATNTVARYVEQNAYPVQYEEE